MPIPAHKLLPPLIAVTIAAGTYFAWGLIAERGPGAGFVSGNGRIEATEIDISIKLPGRLQDLLVHEGDFVTAGQTLAHMQIDTLEAQRREAEAQHRQAIYAEASAQAAVVAAWAQQTGAHSAIAQATIDRIQADIADSDLKAPRDSRVQFRVAQQGEVLGAGAPGTQHGRSGGCLHDDLLLNRPGN